ncbi:hypothetical protein PR202_ga19201 [Eleusine coracana subsp. coracana]|uniref:Uncharacterized protein n=1 Tax=Eleusine coracana subsp. coracana TaxID=191504 RepID=A0AAV5CU07_ELECO|nr:hypothetical protein PR202_ga19201 [Eleusine coracana subsp. coracana]
MAEASSLARACIRFRDSNGRRSGVSQAEAEPEASELCASAAGAEVWPVDGQISPLAAHNAPKGISTKQELAFFLALR